jgi:hypothetical protein
VRTNDIGLSSLAFFFVSFFLFFGGVFLKSGRSISRWYTTPCAWIHVRSLGLLKLFFDIPFWRLRFLLPFYHYFFGRWGDAFSDAEAGWCCVALDCPTLDVHASESQGWGLRAACRAPQRGSNREVEIVASRSRMRRCTILRSIVWRALIFIFSIEYAVLS